VKFDLLELSVIIRRNVGPLGHWYLNPNEELFAFVTHKATGSLALNQSCLVVGYLIQQNGQRIRFRSFAIGFGFQLQRLWLL
jgi:hypothetical protein